MKKKNFIAYFAIFIILMSVISITSLAGSAEIGPDDTDSMEGTSNVTILSIDGASNELHFNYMTPSGPDSFFVVNDNEIYIADRYGKKVNYYKNGTLEKEIYFPEIHFITDFYLAGNEIFLLDDYFPGAYRINDVICADMDGNIKYTINIPNDCAFLGKEPSVDYDRRYRARRIYDTEGYITCEFSDTERYIFKDNEWVKYAEYDIQKSISKNTITFDKWNESIIRTQGEIEYAEIITANRDVFIVSIGVAIENENNCFKDQYLYMVSEKGVSRIVPVKTKTGSILVNKFFLSEDNGIYQMYCDENCNTFVSRLKAGESNTQYVVPEIDSSTFIMLSSADITDAARACAQLNLLRGEGNTVSDEYLSKNTTRAQCLLVGLRLRGYEHVAKKFVRQDNFNDVSGINEDFWNPILAYAYNHPGLGYVGDGDGGFRPADTVTGSELAKIMLTTLGYEQGVDFEWENVDSFAQSKGISVKKGNITNRDLAETILETVKLFNKEGRLLVDILYEKRVSYDVRQVKQGTQDDPRTPYIADVRMLVYDGFVQLLAYDQFGQSVMPPKGKFSSSDTTKITVGDARPGINPLIYVYCDVYGQTSGENSAIVGFESDDGLFKLEAEYSVTGITDKNLLSSISCNVQAEQLAVGESAKVGVSVFDMNNLRIETGLIGYYYEIRRLNDDNPYGTDEIDSPVFEMSRDGSLGMNSIITAKRAGTETLRAVACKGGSYGSDNPNYIEVIYDFTITVVDVSESSED